MANIGLIILAAGTAQRMGFPKQLMEYRGKPMVRHAAETALESCCRPVIVVIGAAADAVGESLDGLPIDIVMNGQWKTGMGSSIRLGMAALVNRDLEAAILSLADMPLITPQILNSLVETYEASGKPIIAAEYAGTVGAPALFSRAYFPLLEDLPFNQGCKTLILKHSHAVVRLACPEAEMDIDTPADYLRLSQVIESLKCPKLI